MGERNSPHRVAVDRGVPLPPPTLPVEYEVATVCLRAVGNVRLPRCEWQRRQVVRVVGMSAAEATAANVAAAATAVAATPMGG